MTNKMNKDRLARIDDDFAEQLKKISLERIKRGIDEQVRSNRELTEMMQRTPSFPQVKEELANTPTKQDFERLKSKMRGIL